jgi:serine/threonine protein kinase
MSITLLNKLGQGNFGQVYKAKKEDGTIMAIKIIEPNKLKYIELDILNRLRSPFLIRALEKPIVETKLGKGLAIQLKEDNIGTLNTKPITYYQMKRIFMSSLYGLKCMHDNNFLHLDISLDNIMYDVDKGGDITAFLGDFGFAARCSDTKTGIISNNVVNKIYIPPEILRSMINNKEKKYNYNQSTDIWSLGIVFLILLGAKFKKYDNKEYLQIIESINEDFIEEKIRLYNRNKMSSQEELELKELLTNMLKQDNSCRIGTKEINNLAFMKNKKLLNSCNLEKPKEIYYMPYICPKVTKGLKLIKELYQTNQEMNTFDQALEEYFLVIQTYTRLMARSKPDLNYEEIKDIINTSVNVSKNYYRRNFQNGSYDNIEILDGEMGYNGYFYKAQSIDDLVILNYYLNNNEQLIAFYNLIEPSQIYTIFKELYNYSNVSKNKISILDFFKIPLPTQKNNNEVMAISSNNYYNAPPDMSEKESNVETIKLVEKNFRNKILEMTREKITSIKEEDNEKINTIYDLLHGNITSNLYQDLKRILGDLSISEKLADFFDYGYIKIINGKIVKKYNNNKNYIIVIEGNRSSLIHKVNKKITHYYSDKNELLESYFSDNNYIYENNFTYGIGNCCVLREPCIIFNIYYNLTEKVEDFSTKCLEKNTFFLILVYTML